MAYTVGIKRRWFFGYRKVQVNGHDWQNFRFILNLTDGSQESIPGFTARGVKVYPDFWTHIAQVERTRGAPAPVVAARPEPPQRPAPAPIQPEPEPDEYREPQPAPETLEVRRRAAERVRTILASEGQH